MGTDDNCLTAVSDVNVLHVIGYSDPKILKKLTPATPFGNFCYFSNL
jgi:hypothetical protein